MKTVTAPKAVRSQEKKRHIYRTAMQLFKHRGFSQTTVRDICREAGVSNGTFYHFFGDKSGVVLEFFQQIYSERESYLNPTKENLTHPFRSVYHYLVHVAALQDLMGKDFIRETMYIDSRVLAAQHLTATRQTDMVQIARFLQAAVDAGTLVSAVHPRDTAEFLITGASGVIFNWITLFNDETAEGIMRRLLPKFIAAVTDEPLDTELRPQPHTAEQED